MERLLLPFWAGLRTLIPVGLQETCRRVDLEGFQGLQTSSDLHRSIWSHEEFCSILAEQILGAIMLLSSKLNVGKRLKVNNMEPTSAGASMVGLLGKARKISSVQTTDC